MDGTSREEVGDQLAYAMKLIIIPLLSRSFELRQHEVVSEAAVESMVKDMFDPSEEVQGKKACASRPLCVTPRPWLANWGSLQAGQCQRVCMRRKLALKCMLLVRKVLVQRAMQWEVFANGMRTATDDVCW